MILAAWHQFTATLPLLQVLGRASLTLRLSESLPEDSAVGWLAGRLTEAGDRKVSVSVHAGCLAAWIARVDMLPARLPARPPVDARCCRLLAASSTAEVPAAHRL